MPLITGLDHINIRTADLAGTKAFFMDVLGLSEGWRPAFPFPGAWLYAGEKDVVHLVTIETPLAASAGRPSTTSPSTFPTMTRRVAASRRPG